MTIIKKELLMEKIKITCDSTCDLTQELYDAYNVSVVPLCITLGEEVARDGIDINTQNVFDYVSANGTLPKTSAVSMADYIDFFSQFTSDGYTVIHINLSSHLSSCHQNARLAAEEVGNVFVIDSQNLSSGSGHLVIAAAELAREGLSADEIADRLNEMKTRLDVSFVLQTVEYLKMGGRCSAIAALGANLLQLRPEIEVADGKMHPAKKYRGSIERSVTDYVKGRLAGRDDVDCKRIFVTHSYVPDAVVEKVVALVRELHPFEEVLVTTAGCTISSHCGPACLGVLFFRK
jgi:DegV family protein with EDD domain